MSAGELSRYPVVQLLLPGRGNSHPDQDGGDRYVNGRFLVVRTQFIKRIGVLGGLVVQAHLPEAPPLARLPVFRIDASVGKVLLH